MWLPWPLISSCLAAPAERREFGAPAGRLRDAVRAVLRDFPEVREEEGLFVTGWSREFGSGEQGLFLGNEYRYRARHEIRISGSTVEVRSTVESRAPGGPRSRRWERTPPDRVEKAILDAIERELEGGA